MSSELYQGETKFFLPVEEQSAAFAALKAKINEQNFPYFIDFSVFENTTTLIEVLDIWGWLATVDSAGNIVTIELEEWANNAHYESGHECLFTLLASYVVPGSFIEMENSGGACWRWYFNGNECLEQEGVIVYTQPDTEEGKTGTTISVVVEHGHWDDAYEQLKKCSMRLNVNNEVVVPNSQLGQRLYDLWALTAGRVILGFSITSEGIRADR